MSIVAGIDYSMTSPAICIHNGAEWHHDNCTFLYLVKREKNLVTRGQFYGELYPEWLADPQRYDKLATWSLKHLKANGCTRAWIEGYALGATGRVFQIAENTGHLKYKLWSEKIKYDTFPPSVIKKLATGKGNANKEKMLESFLAETNIDIRRILDIHSEKQWNPISDIVDAYYICKAGFAEIG